MEQHGQQRPLGYAASLVEEHCSPLGSLLPTGAEQSEAVMLPMLSQFFDERSGKAERFMLSYKKHPKLFFTVTKG